MTPFSSLFRRHESGPRSGTSEETPSETAAPAAAPGGDPDTGRLLSLLLTRLESYLPASGAGVPSNRVSMVSLRERTVGIGNWRGTERRAGFAEIALKGRRLEAVIRFRLWGNSAEAVEDAVDQLHRDLLAATTELWREGFLHIEAKETSEAEHVAAIPGWRKHCDYRILYEYRYQDTDGAESLIARIPIHGQVDTGGRETTEVTDELVRWDDRAAPPLILTASAGRPARVLGLAALATLPAGWDGAPVTLARLRRDAAGPPTDYPDLATFLAAVTRESDPERHARVTFPSVTGFLARFADAGDPVELGDWDEDGTADSYRPARLTFESPIVLPSHDDLLQLSYSDPQLDSKAVLYLRAAATP